MTKGASATHDQSAAGYCFGVSRLRGWSLLPRQPPQGKRTLSAPSCSPFAVFWAYIAYCQYFIIWIGDLPAEVAWYVPRVRGSWGVLALVVLFGQFLLPLLVLLFRSARTNGRVLALLALWLLVMHYADTYWLVLPSLYPDGLHPHWLDLSAVAAVVGGGTAWSAWMHRL